MDVGLTYTVLYSVKHGELKKLIIKPKEGSSPIKETTLSFQVSVGFNN